MQKVSEFFKKSKNVWLDILLMVISFVLPLTILVCIFNKHGFALNNNYNGSTIIMYDMQSIYIAFMRNLRNILVNKQSFIYTMSKTFGGDYLSIYTFYLASPFNFFVALFKEESVPLFFVWSMIVKMSFASLNMYLLERFLSKDRKLGYIAFAIGYGLISYSFVESNNFMWLDGVMVLPLVILGLKLLEKRKCYWVYILSLGYALLTSWYIGAMICMFTVLFFIYLFIANENKFKEKVPLLIRFSVCSLIAGLTSSILWLTGFLHLGGTKATGGLPEVNHMFSPSMFFTGLLENNYTSSSVITLYHGYTSMFTSTITLAFFTLFFFNKGYSLKNRLSALGLFVLYYFIVSNNMLSAIFHGGQEPTWFPTRFSFVVGFLIVYFGYLAYSKLDELWKPFISLPISLTLMGVIIILVTKVPNEIPVGKGDQFYTISVISLILYIFAICLVCIYWLVTKKIKNKTIQNLVLSLSLIVMTSISSIRGANKVLDVNLKDKRFQSYETYLSDSAYQKDVNNIKSLEEYDNYRMELNFNRDGNYNKIDNNPMFYSYNGVSHFCSSEKKDVMSYLGKVGFHYNGFFEKYNNGSTVAMNSLFGIKYLVDDTSNKTSKAIFLNKYPFEKITDLDGSNEYISYYKNTLALPLGFASNHMFNYFVNEGNKVGNVTDWYNHFEYQNQIYKTLCDEVYELDSNNNKILKDIFKPLEIVEVKANHGSFIHDSLDNYYFTSETDEGSLIINFKVQEEARDHNLYVCEKNYYDNATYYLDGKRIDISSYWEKGIQGFKDNLTHEHTLKITFKSKVNNRQIIPELFYENTAVLREYIQCIEKQSSNDLIPFKKAFSYGFEGSFNLTKDHQDYYFTLPFEDNVSIYIDGKNMEVKKVLNIFSGVDLNGLEKGDHKIKFVYRDKGLIVSSIITNIGIGSLVGVTLFYNKFENRVFKKENN